MRLYGLRDKKTKTLMAYDSWPNKGRENSVPVTYALEDYKPGVNLPWLVNSTYTAEYVRDHNVARHLADYNLPCHGNKKRNLEVVEFELTEVKE